MWDIGNVRMQLIRECVADMPLEAMYASHDPTVIAEIPWIAEHTNSDGTLPMSVHSVVIESCGQLILVDTCVGSRHIPEYPVLSDLDDSFMTNLIGAGIAPEAVDLVVCTHLHVDHVGWNTVQVGGRWVPTFPNARYIFGRADFDHWATGAPGAALTFEEAVRPIVEVGLADFVDADTALTAEVSLVPTPGHSPGHFSVVISSTGHEAVITGDIMHHPIQVAAPDWPMNLDHDPDQARQTRRAFLERYADTGTRVFGSHFPGTSTGFVESSGEGFRFTIG